MDTLYVVLPCYNEEECLKDSTSKLKEKMSFLMKENKIKEDSKIVMVDDGSKDKTWSIIEEFSNQDDLFVGVKLAHNKGHQNAVFCGLDYSKEYADMIVSIDADLQDDINAIDKMVDEYYKGNEIVYGVRTSRTTDTAFKRGTAGLYYKILDKMGIEIIDNHADFRLMSKRACQELLKYDETNLFLRGMVPTLGFKHTTVGYERNKRLLGESKYPLKKMLALAWEGITSFSIKPLKFITFLGTFFTSISILIIIIFSFLFGFDVLPLTYDFYILMSIWLALGIILIMMGIVGSYIGKIYGEVKHRPRYIVEKVNKKKE